jgi:hypothetical protein
MAYRLLSAGPRPSRLERRAERLERIVTLTGSVEALKQSVDKMNEQILDVRDRVVRLESQSPLIVETAKNAALEQLVSITNRLVEKVSYLQSGIDIRTEASKSAWPGQGASISNETGDRQERSEGGAGSVPALTGRRGLVK